MRRSVMRRAERPRGEHRMARVGEARDAVDRACGERLRIVERRKDRLEGAREHRLARPRRADEEEVMPARRGDLKSALGRFLSRDVREVDRMSRRGRARRHRRRGGPRATLEMVHDLTERRETERLHTARGRLPRVRLSREDLANSARRGVSDARHRSPNRPERAVQGELAETERGHVDAELAARAKYPESDRELEARSLLAPLGRREIHRDPAKRKLEARVPHRGPYA